MFTTAKIKKLWLLVGACIALQISGCSMSKVATVQNDQIFPGIGTAGCGIGNSIERFYASFGGIRKKEHLLSYETGVEALIEDEKIRTLFFHYLDKKFSPFLGQTDMGIGSNSEINEVIKAYGHPTSVSESIVSEYGPLPGAIEKFIEYDDKGISFSFWNDRLATVIVYRARVQ